MEAVFAGAAVARLQAAVQGADLPRRVGARAVRLGAGRHRPRHPPDLGSNIELRLEKLKLSFNPLYSSQHIQVDIIYKHYLLTSGILAGPEPGSLLNMAMTASCSGVLSSSAAACS